MNKYIFYGVATFFIFNGNILFAQAQKTHADKENEKWHFPADVNSLKNPYSNDAADASNGGVLYQKICSVCHGTKGKGDGIAASGLAVAPANHTSTFVQSQSDGHLFWEITSGHAPMPAYKTVLTDKQRWELVTYIRTLKAESKSKSHK